MISVAESARLLGVSPARVRALIASGTLPAQKIGRSWALRQEDVVQRLAQRPAPGRPRAAKAATQAAVPERDPTANDPTAERHDLFLACKHLLGSCPSAADLASAPDDEEAGFYIAVADYFLQRKQAELVRAGVY